METIEKVEAEKAIEVVHEATIDVLTEVFEMDKIEIAMFQIALIAKVADMAKEMDGEDGDDD